MLVAGLGWVDEQWTIVESESQDGCEGGFGLLGVPCEWCRWGEWFIISVLFEGRMVNEEREIRDLRYNQTK